MSVWDAVGTVTRPVTLPVQLVHELTHLAAARPWVEDWQIVIGPAWSDGELDVYMNFDEDAPRWGIALSYLAPMFAGLLALVAVGGWITVHGLPLPSDLFTLLLWAGGALAWSLYTLPSTYDVDGAIAVVNGNVEPLPDDD